MSLADVTELDPTPSVLRPGGLGRDEALALGQRLAELSRMVERTLTDALAARGLTRNAWLLLTALDAEGVGVALPAGDWGARADLSPSSMSAAADLLYRAGWVNRWRDPDNRRSVLIALTEGGADAAATTRGVLVSTTPAVGRDVSAAQLRQLSELVALVLADGHGGRR